LTEQLLGYFRDMMTVLVGCKPDMLLYCTTDDYDDLGEAGQQMGLTTVIAVQQILDQTLTRVRQSVHVRILVELAIVRICNLENLDDLARLISGLEAGAPQSPAGSPRGSGAAAPRTRQQQSAPPTRRENPAAVRPSPPAADGPAADARATRTANESPAAPSDSGATATGPSAGSKRDTNDVVAERAETAHAAAPAKSERLTPENARRVWDETLAAMGDMTAENASRYSRVAVTAPNALEVTFSGKYTSSKTFCERPERVRQLEQALAEATGGPVRLIFSVETTKSAPAKQPKPRQTQRELIRQKASNPLVRHAMELFDAHVTRVDPPRDPPPDARS
jgi:DNA polymerase-3 subunit gamma/tau